MRQMGIDEASPIKPLYVVVGTSRVLLERFIEGLKNKIKRVDGCDVVFERVRADEDISSALSRFSTIPLFGGVPLLLLEGGDIALLQREWFKRRDWGRGVLVVQVDSLDTKGMRLLKEWGVEVVSAVPPSRFVDLVMFLRREAISFGLRLSESEAEELLRRVDRDFDSAVSEIQKLAAGGGRVTELVADHAPSKAFDLTGAVEEWDAKKALHIVKRSFEEGIRAREGHRVTTPQDVVVNLLQQIFYGLTTLKEVVDGMRDLPDWRMRRVRNGLLRLGRKAVEKIKRAMRLLHEADLCVKTGGDPRITIEGFILQALV